MIPQVRQVRRTMHQMIFLVALDLAVLSRAELSANLQWRIRVMENPETLPIHHNYKHRRLIPTK
jgi:hypothetical protein